MQGYEVSPPSSTRDEMEECQGPRQDSPMCGKTPSQQPLGPWGGGGKYTSFSEYRLAFKARLIFLPTRTVRKRSGEPIRDTSCPKCHEEHKTLAHVINHCPPHAGLVWLGITTSAYRLLTTSNDPAVTDTAVSD